MTPTPTPTPTPTAACRVTTVRFESQPPDERAAARRLTPRLAAVGVAVALGALFAGCSSTPLDAPTGAPVENRDLNGGMAANAGAATAGGQSRVTPVDLPPPQANDAATGGRIVYFDFDSYAIKDDYRGVVDRYGRLLAADRKKQVQVEGHTDERGGREYNLALGQKRAEAVAKALTLLGAGSAQVEAVSFGKERPAVQGSDEAAFAKNRRAEINAR